MTIQRDCMRDLIRRELIRRIIEGQLKPGDRLLELQLAREFNTSQSPVREALRELATLRLVETESYRGTRVRALSEREMREASEVRAIFEESAARAGVERVQANIGLLRDDYLAIRDAADAHDVQEYARRNTSFHRQIVEASGNEVMLRLWDSLLIEARTVLNLSSRPNELLAIAETHRPIVESFEAGDGERAARLLRDHAQAAIPIFEVSDTSNSDN